MGKSKSKHNQKKSDEASGEAATMEKPVVGEDAQDNASVSSHGSDEENYNFQENGENQKQETSEEASNNSDEEPEKKQETSAEGKNKKRHKELGDNFLRKTENFNDKLRKRGVVYVARVPPKMTPTKIKSLLSDFGEITRVYLVEEDKAVRQRRRKQGGSGAKRYTEGWVEFAKKRIAKHVALSLNNTPITKYKRSAHYGKNILCRGAQSNSV